MNIINHEEIISKLSNPDECNTLHIIELKKLAKHFNLTNYSKLNKQELIVTLQKSIHSNINNAIIPVIKKFIKHNIFINSQDTRDDIIEKIIMISPNINRDKLNQLNNKKLVEKFKKLVNSYDYDKIYNDMTNSIYEITKLSIKEYQDYIKIFDISKQLKSKLYKSPLEAYRFIVCSKNKTPYSEIKIQNYKEEQYQEYMGLFSSLPNEIIQHIFGYLDPFSKTQFLSSNSLMYTILGSIEALDEKEKNKLKYYNHYFNNSILLIPRKLAEFIDCYIHPMETVIVTIPYYIFYMKLYIILDKHYNIMNNKKEINYIHYNYKGKKSRLLLCNNDNELINLIRTNEAIPDDIKIIFHKNNIYRFHSNEFFEMNGIYKKSIWYEQMISYCNTLNHRDCYHLFENHKIFENSKIK